MIKVKLTRSFHTPGVTLGMLQIEGADHAPIYTLENPWKNNKPWISCIPTGLYQCRPFSGKKYPDVYEVIGVEDRSAILIHWGNWERNTNGCILLGLASGPIKSAPGLPAVQSSKKAVEYFKRLIGPQEFILEIGD